MFDKRFRIVTRLSPSNDLEAFCSGFVIGGGLFLGWLCCQFVILRDSVMPHKTTFARMHDPFDERIQDLRTIAVAQDRLKEIGFSGRLRLAVRGRTETEIKITAYPNPNDFPVCLYGAQNEITFSNDMLTIRIDDGPEVRLPDRS